MGQRWSPAFLLKLLFTETGPREGPREGHMIPPWGPLSGGPASDISPIPAAAWVLGGGVLFPNERRSRVR